MKDFEVTFCDLGSKQEISQKVNISEDEKDGKINIKASVNGKEFSASNYAYLQAYQEFRDKLLSAGYGIKCCGSLVNAVQPEMMGDTDKILLLEIGKKASMKDTAHIWDKAEIDDFPDTEKQNEFFVKWASR